MTAVGVTLGIFFSIKILLWALLFCSLLSLGWAFLGSHNQMMAAVVTVVTLQVGYFFGMVIRTVLEVCGFDGLGSPRSRRRSHSRPFRPSPDARRRRPCDRTTDVRARTPPAAQQ